MFRIKSVDDLSEFISYVVLCAPDRLSNDEDLPPENRMDLERAFEHLRSGVQIAYPEVDFEPKRRVLYSILDRALDGYRAGDEKVGAHALYDFRRSIFKEG
jgi:hypothetical protein